MAGNRSWRWRNRPAQENLAHFSSKYGVNYTMARELIAIDHAVSRIRPAISRTSKEN
jgi:hypothetical protein